MTGFGEIFHHHFNYKILYFTIDGVLHKYQQFFYKAMQVPNNLD